MNPSSSSMNQPESNNSTERLGCSVCLKTLNSEDVNPDMRSISFCNNCSSMYHSIHSSIHCPICGSGSIQMSLTQVIPPKLHFNYRIATEVKPVPRELTNREKLLVLGRAGILAVLLVIISLAIWAVVTSIRLTTLVNSINIIYTTYVNIKPIIIMSDLLFTRRQELVLPPEASCDQNSSTRGFSSLIYIWHPNLMDIVLGCNQSDWIGIIGLNGGNFRRSTATEDATSLSWSSQQILSVAGSARGFVNYRYSESDRSFRRGEFERNEYNTVVSAISHSVGGLRSYIMSADAITGNDVIVIFSTSRRNSDNVTGRLNSRNADHPVWSPNSEMIAYSDASNIYLVYADSFYDDEFNYEGSTIITSSDESYPDGPVAWLPDSTGFIFTVFFRDEQFPPQLYRFDIATEAFTALTEEPGGASFPVVKPVRP